jgi:hypothetical protein
MAEAWWFWLALAGLGALHGLNPAMGWLFAVALGLNRQSRATVYVALLPIAAGHALSVGLAGVAFVLAGFTVNAQAQGVGLGLLLIGWGLYHWGYRHRHRVRIGMRTGLAGILLWSFLTATAHGAGPMLWPILMPVCFPADPGQSGGEPALLALTGVLVHSAGMLATTAALACVVYEWVGLGMLRRAWINLDAVWTAALLLAGGLLVFSSPENWPLMGWRG